ncbi:MAG: efflux RND transporter permease subunit [Saprospiraceae bacterium]|jgi:multidrug efflux pump subunit AcrB|nr:efflux RND transporter permease subunit [Saprospiraceae bacterium]MBK6479661.1 efflux RND transporter permease subunit [Saprospiraceae bacterium]MBK6815371.1 efflux RND transporter permease subunit [Saprospiraceae bacterium]MBK7372411.1 efflux RND transporter permease subunit [Saprospiraceae bacterium]MBK7608040.1 efflux RND transporter permease subunit [Saprospiraceae bacterium]
MKDIIKEFKPSSWAIDNKTSIYILTIIITIAGIFSYIRLPKEQFPEVAFPQILVNTIYPGTSPADMENLVAKPIEKQLKGISGIKKVRSSSLQDFCLVVAEFGTDVDVAEAKLKVKDAVDRARADLPSDLPQDPSVIDIDVSSIPIMNIHVSGDYDLDRLKNYADDIKDRVESLKEITRADLVGALTREIQINVDMYKMTAAKITMRDIESAVAMENMTISGGQIDMGNVKRAISVVGEYRDARKLGDIVIRGGTGAITYLKDIAEVSDTFKEQESYARLNKKNVLTLNIIKRSGENLIATSDKIKAICEDMKANAFPADLNVNITGDLSIKTRSGLKELINTIIIGFILVTFILMFFMGTTNALFVALSVPLSMFVAFLIMPTYGFTLNVIVLFGFLLALGIVVDDAIVVIENTHRIFDNGKVPIKKAAKLAAGEVFLPVLSGTLTSLAPFIPLAFWPGLIGNFMFGLPITLITTLLASLFVAYIINPVFAVDFMKPHDPDHKEKIFNKGFIITLVVFGVIMLLSHLGHNMFLRNLTFCVFLFYLLNKFVLGGIIRAFQNNVWPRVQNGYASMLRTVLKGYRPIALLLFTIFLLIASIVITAKFIPGVRLFPESDPNFVYTYIALPVGTSQAYTNKITSMVEDRIIGVVGENNPIVESVISNVAIGAGDPSNFEQQTSPHLGKVTVAFVEFEKRHGQSSADYLSKIREVVQDIPGAEIIVEKENNGPPAGKPISIEISGDDFDELTSTAKLLKQYLDELQIGGVEELKSDISITNPQLKITVDRQRANREGISTAQIGSDLRNAVFGKEISKLRDGEDQHPIMLRFQEDQRNNINLLLNQSIIYRDMNMGGQMRQVPMASLTKMEYGNTVGSIKRKNLKRIVTISSNVLNGFNPNEVLANVQAATAKFQGAPGVTIGFAGEQEDQAEAMGFLGRSLLISLGLIFLILVTQFNSFSKPMVILIEIVFSIIGVLLGFTMIRMEFSIIMTGIGVVALAGVVVRNGILLVEFADMMMKQGYNIREATIEAGRTRMTPVILTAMATVFGLIPLAIGFNIDFVSLFTEWKPNIFLGGDNVAFWGPLSWTMIFGLGFATLLTLILVPALMVIVSQTKSRFGLKSYEQKALEEAAEEI